MLSKILIGTMGILLTSVGTVFAGTCTCGDQAAVQSRLKQTEAAITGYRTADPGNLNIPATNQNKDDVNTWMKVTYMDKAADGTNVGSGATTSNLCGIDVNDDAPECLVDSYETHEEVHADFCRSVGTWKFLASGTENVHMAAGATLGDYVKEEIRAYEAERDCLSQKMKLLSKNCPSRDYSVDHECKRDISALTAVKPPTQKQFWSKEMENHNPRRQAGQDSAEESGWGITKWLNDFNILR